MTLDLVAVAFDTPDPTPVARFWAALLEREVVQEVDGFLLRGTQPQVGLRFVAADSQSSGNDVLHLHLTSETPADQDRVVEAALTLGATHCNVGQRPEEGHVVLADPGGHPFCVIRPANQYLAGCGPLGEVACDGSRALGLFWQEALGWPLVWDLGEETAIQSPLGGTKISWGGESFPPGPRGNRQRLHLGTSDLSADVDRLLALVLHAGARRT